MEEVLQINIGKATAMERLAALSLPELLQAKGACSEKSML